MSGAAVVIVGGGVTGLSAAWWLARDGVDVLVLDKGLIGWEASGRNGGGCTHAHSPLFAEEQRLWPQMDELLGHPTEWRPYRIGIARNEADFDRLSRAYGDAHRAGFRSSRLDGKALRELVPLVGEGAFGGLFHHFGGHANPQRTVQAYGWALQALGGRIRQHTRVTGFETAGGRVVAVQAGPERYGCEAVVLAAGPRTGSLTRMLGREVPVAPARAEMFVTEPLPLLTHGGFHGSDLYGRQTLRGNLVYGGGPHEWLGEAEELGPAPPTSPLLGHMARRIAEILPGAARARVIRSWGGVIENTPDGRPVIDRLDEPDNVTVATMSSVGFGLSPASGHAVAELVQHGACSFADLRTLRLSRFANLPRDWRERQGWVPPVEAEAAA